MAEGEPALQAPSAGSNTSAAMASGAAFTDVGRDHWAYSGIASAVKSGYVQGYEDGTFKPNRSVTRAEFIKMAAQALRLDKPEAAAGGKWYVPYVDAAVAAGIFVYTDFNKDWDKPITRFEMSRIAIRASAGQGEKKEFDTKEVMYQATKKGLITGLGAGELGKDKPTTRAQAIAIVERILTAKSGGKLKVDKYAVGNAEIEFRKTNIFTVMPDFFKDPLPKKDWNPDNLFVETKDGLYRGEVIKIVAIDLEDPNDPNRKLVPHLDELRWDDFYSDETSPLIKNFKKSYLFYVDSKIIYAKDNHKYNIYETYQPFTLYGLKVNIQDLQNHKLTSWSPVFYKKEGDFPAFIIPKSGFTQDGAITINIYSPARPGTGETIKDVYVAKGPHYPY